jgi:hypothetical protein
MKGAKKVIWEKGGRGIHEIKERKKEKELKRRFPNCTL